MAERESNFDWGDSGSEPCIPDQPNLNESEVGAGGVFVPPELAAEIIGAIYDTGCVTGFAKHYPMKRHQLVIRTLDDSVEGYWVGAQCVKEKDAPQFGAVSLTAEKMAVILPFEDQLLEDMDTDLVSLMQGDVTRKFIEKIDKTFMGYEITSPFGDSLSGNTPLAHSIPMGTEVDLAGDISAAISECEKDGYDPNGMIASKAIRHILRNLRDADHRPIYTENLGDCAPRERYCVFGVPICFTNQAVAQSSPAGYEILIADFNYVLVGDRTGLQVARSNEATLTSGSLDNINLFEQDMTAYRYVIRTAFAIARDNALAKVTGVA